ncbi:MAG: CoA-binding protein [Candidatus Desulforudis sp.]|nr:CoA-binding protein [Desulforudis sp.]
MRELIDKGRTVAVVGLSPKPDRDSHRVAAYLQAHGYRIIPVHPRAVEILGEPVYRRLEDIPVPVDIVYVFRRSEDVLPFVEAALRLQPRAIWLPLGVVSAEAAAVAAAHGITAVMDRCMLIEHGRILGA